MLNVVDLEQSSPGMPTQWEGRTDDDRPVYARYRFGQLIIRAGERGGDIWSAVRGRDFYRILCGDKLDGMMTYERLQSLTRRRVRWPDAPPRQVERLRAVPIEFPEREGEERNGEFLTFDLDPPLHLIFPGARYSGEWRETTLEELVRQNQDDEITAVTHDIGELPKPTDDSLAAELERLMRAMRDEQREKGEG